MPEWNDGIEGGYFDTYENQQSSYKRAKSWTKTLDGKRIDLGVSNGSGFEERAVIFLARREQAFHEESLFEELTEAWLLSYGFSKSSGESNGFDGWNFELCNDDGHTLLIVFFPKDYPDPWCPVGIGEIDEHEHWTDYVIAVDISCKKQLISLIEFMICQ